MLNCLSIDAYTCIIMKLGSCPWIPWMEIVLSLAVLYPVMFPDSFTVASSTQRKRGRVRGDKMGGNSPCAKSHLLCFHMKIMWQLPHLFFKKSWNDLHMITGWWLFILFWACANRLSLRYIKGQAYSSLLRAFGARQPVQGLSLEP